MRFCVLTTLKTITFKQKKKNILNGFLYCVHLLFVLCTTRCGRLYANEFSDFAWSKHNFAYPSLRTVDHTKSTDHFKKVQVFIHLLLSFSLFFVIFFFCFVFVTAQPLRIHETNPRKLKIQKKYFLKKNLSFCSM